MVDAGRSQRQDRAGVSWTGFHTPSSPGKLPCTYPECSCEKHILLTPCSGHVAGGGQVSSQAQEFPPSVICSPSLPLPPCASAHSNLAFAPVTLLKQLFDCQRPKLPKCHLFPLPNLPALLPKYASVQAPAAGTSTRSRSEMQKSRPVPRPTESTGSLTRSLGQLLPLL